MPNWGSTWGNRDPDAAAKPGYSPNKLKKIFKMMRIGGTQHSLESVKSSQVYAAEKPWLGSELHNTQELFCGFWLQPSGCSSSLLIHPFSKTVSLCSWVVFSNLFPTNTSLRTQRQLSLCSLPFWFKLQCWVHIVYRSVYLVHTR